MGSLPNLHELGKQEGEDQGYKPGPALGHLCGGCNGALSTAEKSRILHRYSGHNKIAKARSNPHESNKIVYDDVMVEHMATYSPISTRSRFNLNIHTAGTRRRDSINSSIGATSVRRLLAVVRGGGHGSQTGRIGSVVYTRTVLIINLLVVCICHLLCTAVYLPFLALQSSISVWSLPLGKTRFDIKVGSLLISSSYMVAAGVALLAPCALKRFNATNIILTCYGGMVVFYMVHLYPTVFVTVPACLLLGMIQGLSTCAHVSFLMILSHRITGLFHEEEEEVRQARRTCIIRRVARAFQGAQDIGLIVGSILSAILISYTIKMETMEFNRYNNSTVGATSCSNNSSNAVCNISTQTATLSTATYLEEYNSFLDDIFDKTEDGRLCGAQACPISVLTINSTLGEGTEFRVLPTASADILAAVYAGACLLAFVLACLVLDRIKLAIYQDAQDGTERLAALRSLRESFRDKRLQMAAPLAIFIGIEQAFMYADFSKSYVVCTIGIHRLNLVFLAMGLLQSVAACTLSMLLRTIRRYYVVGVGFTFHGCLLMVLMLWKPTEDDPALFYVISASWGVCNSIWEMLSFTFLTGQYAENWESAFAIMAFFKYLGLSLAFAFHGILCNVWKLYALAFFMMCAAVSSAWLEIRLENIRKIKNITRL